MTQRLSAYAGSSVVVLGGAGFLGSHVARRLAALGARVTAVDPLFDFAGGNRFNLLDSPVDFLHEDVRHPRELPERLAECDLVVDAMGTTGHRWAYAHAQLDLECNVLSHLALIDLCGQVGARPRVVVLGTRAVYGRARPKALAESDATDPVDLQGAHKLLSEQHFRLLGERAGLRTVLLRLGNCYGPGQRLAGEDVGLAGGLLRALLSGGTAVVYGGVARERDFLFASDAADAVLAAGLLEDATFTVLNVAGVRVPVVQVADLTQQRAGRGAVEMAPFPAEVAALDPGDIVLDCTAAAQRLAWAPATPVERGIEETVDFYLTHGSRYGLVG